MQSYKGGEGEGLGTSTSLIYLDFIITILMFLLSADWVPFLVAENDTEENCYAYNSSTLADDALPLSCVDGCCCVAVNLTCPCILDPFYICRNGSYLDIREPCDCPTELCICIRNSIQLCRSITLASTMNVPKAAVAVLLTVKKPGATVKELGAPH